MKCMHGECHKPGRNRNTITELSSLGIEMILDHQEAVLCDKHWREIREMAMFMAEEMNGEYP